MWPEEIKTELMSMTPISSEAVARYASVLIDGPGLQPDFVEAIQSLPQSIAESMPYDAGALLRDAWEYSSDFLVQRYGETNVVRMFELIGVHFLLPFEAEELYTSLPESIVVYRGGHAVAEAGRGMSWTYHLETAVYHSQGREPIVVEGRVSKADILTIVPLEHEVVVRPGSVVEIKQVELPSEE